MIDLGEFTPATTLGPRRVPGGGTELGRLTTTDEQRAEAVEWMTRQLEQARKTEGRARILWSRGESTMLELTVDVEHLGTERVYVPREPVETMLNGAVVPHSEATRMRVLGDELRDLVDRDMLK